MTWQCGLTRGRHVFREVDVWSHLWPSPVCHDFIVGLWVRSHVICEHALRQQVGKFDKSGLLARAQEIGIVGAVVALLALMDLAKVGSGDEQAWVSVPIARDVHRCVTHSCPARLHFVP
jgi:hypothetical protein